MSGAVTPKETESSTSTAAVARKPSRDERKRHMSDPARSKRISSPKTAAALTSKQSDPKVNSQFGTSLGVLISSYTKLTGTGMRARLTTDVAGSGSTSTTQGSDPQRQTSSSERPFPAEQAEKVQYGREHSTGSFTAANVDLASIEAEFAANYSVDLSRVTAIRFRNRHDSQEVDAIFIYNDGETTVADSLSFQEQVELEGYLKKRKDKFQIEGGDDQEMRGSMEDRMFRQESETMMLKDRVDKIYYSPGMPGAIEAQEEYNTRRKQDRDTSDKDKNERKHNRDEQDNSYYSMREGHVVQKK